jgi:hypothetical protein
MLDVLWENGHPVKTSIEPLHLLGKFAPENVRCIRFLGLGGRGGKEEVDVRNYTTALLPELSL